jgi:CMP-N-acetylneuraminic acid synthetase
MHIGDEISRICSTTKTFAKFLPTSNNEETQDMSLHLKSYLFLPKQSLSKHTPNNQKLHLAKISEFLTTITEFAKNLILWEICKFSK